VAADLRDRLATDGFALERGVLDADLVDRLAAATDLALEAEAGEFPPGDEQHGRALFAVEYGGPFVELLDHDALMAPLEAAVGHDAILYTMTTSVVLPGADSPAAAFHVDLPADRPDGLALGFIALLDRFTVESGSTEFLRGSHRAGADASAGSFPPVTIDGEPGDVCYFDPRILHRAGSNRTGRARRGVLALLVQPWMKQRFDVAAIVPSAVRAALSPTAARRLGLEALPPGSHEEFRARRRRTPW
jgi:ectoine hydroxylase-related dioxygenase (phytanoyl-CoA dioxygenase family)